MLPFTADVLFASFAQYNRGLWPAQVLACVLALSVILLAVQPVRLGDRVIGALLAIAWLWTGVGYHYLHFQTLNFAAPVYAALFVIQGGLFVWGAAPRSGPSFRFRPDRFGWAGLTLAIVALVAWPVADVLTGHSWRSVRLVGLAPAPTTVFTFGLLLLIDGRTPVRLAIIPLLWTLVAGATAWVLSIAHDLALPVVGLVGFGMILWKNQRQRPH